MIDENDRCKMIDNDVNRWWWYMIFIVDDNDDDDVDDNDSSRCWYMIW